MERDKPMSLLLIEDDVAACRNFRECAKHRPDVDFVGMTGCSDEGMEFVKTRLPEGVILDLELNHGRGSGLEFLKELNKTALSFRPIVVVTTRNRSELVYESLHEYGIEWVFCKKQQGYCPERVISHLISLRPFLHTAERGGVSDELRTLETPEEQRVRLMQRVDSELNAIGISPRFKGRPQIRAAIFRLTGKGKNEPESVFHETAAEFQTRYNNVIRNIQAAIHHTWRHTDVETLEECYKAPIKSSDGVPTPTEFIHYYADMIRDTL